MWTSNGALSEVLLCSVRSYKMAWAATYATWWNTWNGTLLTRTHLRVAVMSRLEKRAIVWREIYGIDGGDLQAMRRMGFSSRWICIERLLVRCCDVF